MFALSFAEDMISNLYAINENAKVNESGTHILKQYIEFIDMHSDVIELSIRMINRMVIIECLYIILCFFIRMVNLFSEVYQTVTATLFTGSIIAICMAMLLFQMEIVK